MRRLLNLFKEQNRISVWLTRHFGAMSMRAVVMASRQFPTTCRVDLHRALHEVFSKYPRSTLVGVHASFCPTGMSFTQLLDETHVNAMAGPLQHDEVDIGEDHPARCLVTGLWLAQHESQPFAVLVSPAEKYGRTSGVHLEIAVPPGEWGANFSQGFFQAIERVIAQSAAYRGKIISLEVSDDYRGHLAGVKVHKLSPVGRDEVILPEKTLRLLERNVTDFVAQRDGLRGLSMSSKKGLLFYGPPGTGKTHTIRYLASRLEGHTTLLITASQVALLDEYAQLARFLQPAMVVIEDVDLIARPREDMRSACEESLLNKLLNEMDGLREDASILFVLTTNRPEQIESALAARPGRVDQAIEFPLPDEAGRRKLSKLYARSLSVPDEILELILRKTKGASAAFIKELMRRAAQLFLHEGAQGKLTAAQIDGALEEMLFSGGSLNRKLLGVVAET